MSLELEVFIHCPNIIDDDDDDDDDDDEDDDDHDMIMTMMMMMMTMTKNIYKEELKEAKEKDFSSKYLGRVLRSKNKKRAWP